MVRHRKRITVEWGDCDPAGIVYFPNYLSWCDSCTNALFAAAGMPLQPLFRRHDVIGIPVVDVRSRFLIPSAFGDELLVDTELTEFRRSSFVVRHQFFKEKELAVEAFVTRVWAGADPEKKRPLKSRLLPKEVIDNLSRLEIT